MPVQATREGFRLAVARSGALVRATQIVFAKATVARRQPPVLRDLAEYRAADFHYDTSSLEGVKRLIDAVPANAQGMRWIHKADVEYFYVERDLHAPYDQFVSRVDISRVGLAHCWRWPAWIDGSG